MKRGGVSFIGVRNCGSFGGVTIYLRPVGLLVNTGKTNGDGFLSLFRVLNGLCRGELTSCMTRVNKIGGFFCRNLGRARGVRVRVKRGLGSCILSLVRSSKGLLVTRRGLKCSCFKRLSAMSVKGCRRRTKLGSCSKVHEKSCVGNCVSRVHGFRFRSANHHSPFATSDRVIGSTCHVCRRNRGLTTVLCHVRQRGPVTCHHVVHIVRDITPCFSSFCFRPARTSVIHLR